MRLYSLQSPRPTPASADPRRGVRHDTHDIIRQQCELRLYQEQATGTPLSQPHLSLSPVSHHMSPQALTKHRASQPKNATAKPPHRAYLSSLARILICLSLSLCSESYTPPGRLRLSSFGGGLANPRVIAPSPPAHSPLSPVHGGGGGGGRHTGIRVCLCESVPDGCMVKGRVAGHVVSQNGALAARRACAALVP